MVPAHRGALSATLIVKPTPPNPGRRHVYLYDVAFDGEVIVADSSDAEFDLARALLARGITGIVTVVDRHSGKPRALVNIEKAAKLRTVEEQRSNYFGKWYPPPEMVPEQPTGSQMPGETPAPLGEAA
jgi:hypothetical protein